MTDRIWKDPDFLRSIISLQRAEIESMKGVLEKIAGVCTYHMDRAKNHRMALDYVREIANDKLEGKPCQAKLIPQCGQDGICSNPLTE